MRGCLHVLGQPKNAKTIVYLDSKLQCKYNNFYIWQDWREDYYQNHTTCEPLAPLLIAQWYGNPCIHKCFIFTCWVSCNDLRSQLDRWWCMVAGGSGLCGRRVVGGGDGSGGILYEVTKLPRAWLLKVGLDMPVWVVCCCMAWSLPSALNVLRWKSEWKHTCFYLGQCYRHTVTFKRNQAHRLYQTHIYHKILSEIW